MRDRDELEICHVGTFTSPTATLTRRTVLRITTGQRRILAALGVDQPPLISGITLPAGDHAA